MFDKSFSITSSNNTISSESEAFNTRNSTLVNNSIAFNTIGSGVSSSSIDFNGVNNTTSTSGVNILSDNNRVFDKSFAVNSSNNTVSSNSEAFSTRNSTLVNNALAINAVNSNVLNNSISINSTGINSNNRTLDILGITNNISNSSISINSINTTSNDRSLSINTINSTVSSRSFSLGSNNSTVILSSIDLFGSNNNLQNTSIGFAGSNVVSIKGNTNFIGTKNSELNSTNSLAIGGTNITQSLCANNTSTGNNILTIGGTNNKVGSNSLVIGGTNNLISNNSVSIGGSNNSTSTYSNVLMLNVNNTTADRSNLVYLPATYVVGDIIVNGKLSASGGVFEIDKSILASDSAIRINNTFSPSAALIVEQSNASYNIAEFNFGLSKKPVFYIGSDGVSVNTKVLIPSNALTVNGDISANKNINLVNSSVLNIGDTNLYRSATNTIKTDDNFVVGTLATSTTDDSVIVENSGTLRKRTINNRIWDTNATFLSGVGLTTNNLPKAEGPNKLVPSNISDNLGVVSISVPTKITGHNSLQLEGGTHTYIEWYPSGLLSGRKAWTGFGNTGDNRFSIVNQHTDGSGHVNLIPGQNANVGISNIPGFVPSRLLTITGVASASSSTFNGGTALVRIQGSTSQFSEPALEFAELSLSPTARIASKNISNGGGDLIFQTRSSSSLTSSLLERVIISVDGNVGIGTTAPINYTGYVTQTMQSLSGAVVTLGRSNAIRSEWGDTPNEVYFKVVDSITRRLWFGTNNVERMTIAANGNVGIGTSNPSASLQFANIHGKKISMWDAFNDDNQFYGFGIDTGTLVYNVESSGARHVFYSGINSTSKRELFRISGDGTVSLSAGNLNLSNNHGLYWSANTDAASMRFESTGDSAGQSKLILETMDNSDEPIVLRQASADRLYVGTGGRVGIGSSNPLARLTVGSELGGTAASTTFTTNAGALGTTALSRLKLASIGFTSYHESSLGIEALRVTAGSSWETTAVGLKLDVDNSSSVNNTEIWLRSNGCIGIGTSSPIGKLSVYDSTNADINLQYGSDDLWWITANQAGVLKIGGTGASRPTSGAINILDTGNVGIGTTSPQGKLDVNGGFTIIRPINDNPTGGHSILIPRSGTDPFTNPSRLEIRVYESESVIYNHWAGTGVSRNLTVGSGGAYHYYNGTTGRIGIGTNNPYTGLHVKGTQLSDDFGIVVENTDLNGYSSICFGSENPVGGLTAGIWRNGSSVTGYAGASSLNIGSSLSNTNVGFVTNNTTRMIVLSSGNVGIRTLTPNTALTINGDLSSNSQVYARGITITPAASSDTTPDLTLVSPNNSLDTTWFYNNLATGAYNPLSQIGDKGIIFSSNTSQTEGNMIIGPWSSVGRGIVIDGINGRVGINKRPTLATFDVNGSIGSSGNLSVYGGSVFIGRQNSTNEGGEIQFARASDNSNDWSIDSHGSTSTPDLRFFNATAASVKMFINGSTGNVGIGNFSVASFPLSLGTTLGNKIGLYDSGSGNGFGFGIQNGMMQIFSQINTNRVGIGYGNSSAFTETLTVKGSNVGIGNTDPSARLSVGPAIAGTALSTVFVTNAGSLGTTALNRLKLASIGFQSSNSSSLGIEALRVTAGSSWDTTAIGLKLDVDNTSSVNNTELWLRSNGCIGIGTGSPSSKLHVVGQIVATTDASKRIYIGGDSNATDVEIGTLESDVTELHVYNKANSAFMTTKMSNVILTNLATSTTDNSVLVESSGLSRKRTINPRVWDTAATFLSGSGFSNALSKFSSTGLTSSGVSDDGTTITMARQARIEPLGTAVSPSLLFGNNNNNGMYYSGTDGLMTSLAGLEKFRINSNYVYSPNKVGIGTTSIGTEMLSVAGSIKHGSMSFPSFEGNIDFGGDGAGTWRRLINANLGNIIFSTIGFTIEITDPRTNHAPSEGINATVETIKFNVACIRTQGTTLNSPDVCYVSGPVSGMIRAIRLSTGNYEIQISNRVQSQEYYVKIYAYAANGPHTINYYGGDAATVVTTQTIYNSTGGQKIEYFDKGIFTGTGNHDYGHYLQLKEVAAGNNDGPKILFEKNTPIKRWSIGSAKGATDNGFGIYEGSSTTAEGTNRLYLAAGGNIGIGTTSAATERLTIVGADTASNTGISFSRNSKSKWHINHRTVASFDSLEIGTNSTSGHLGIESDRINIRKRLVLLDSTIFTHDSNTKVLGLNPYSENSASIYKLAIGYTLNVTKIILNTPYDNIIFTIMNNSSEFGRNIVFASSAGWLRIPGGTRTLGQGECCSFTHWKDGIFAIF